MDPSRAYKPFLIGEGKQTAGLFTYLESWIKPQTAYDVLENAYIYRGSLYQRNGFTLFPSVPAAGALLYQNNEVQVQAGAGNTGPYGGTLANFPLIATVTITAQIAGSKRSSTASFGPGTVAWSTGGTSLAAAIGGGGINFTTGVWTLTSSAAILLNAPIVIQYTYIPTNTTPTVNNPIMGIKQFVSENTNTTVLVVLDTRRASFWDDATNQFQPLSQFQQYFYQFPDPNAQTATNNGTDIFLNWTNATSNQFIAPYSLTVKTFNGTTGALIDTVTDVPTNSTSGVFTSAGTINGAISAIDYTTGAIRINFTGAPTARTLVQITGSMRGDYFNGDNTNFFNAVNWDTPDMPVFLYLTNNVDPITTFTVNAAGDELLARPPFALYSDSVTRVEPSQVLLPFRNDVARCLDVQVYNNRLLLLRPTIFNKSPHTLRTFSENQSVYFSCARGVLSFNPTNFVLPTEIAGNGGFIAATTGEILQCEELIRDIVIVFFTNSTWIMRSTGSPVDPFRFYRLNVSRTTNAPYGSIAYDVTASSMGARGLIMSDGVGVERYDEEVIDLFEDINNNAFGQCFAQRYDAENQSWMLFPADATDSLTSDRIIVYNFLEESWAIYIPNLGNLIQTPTSPNTLSCLGLGFTTKDITWDDLAAGTPLGGPNGMTWNQANFTWNHFLEQDLTPSLLAGDQNGFVFIADDGPFDQVGPQNSAPNPIQTKVITKRLNPFIQSGQKACFGAIDVYYQVNNGGQIRLNIYGNNSNLVYKSFLFTLDGNTSGDFAWKRFYINITGEFIQIEFNSFLGNDRNNVPQYNPSPPFKILGMVLWACEGGRLTPGTYL